jgi:hypothetical protein
VPNWRDKRLAKDGFKCRRRFATGILNFKEQIIDWIIIEIYRVDTKFSDTKFRKKNQFRSSRNFNISVFRQISAKNRKPNREIKKKKEQYLARKNRRKKEIFARYTSQRQGIAEPETAASSSSATLVPVIILQFVVVVWVLCCFPSRWSR